MEQGSLQILIVMVVYMVAVIGIGIFFARRANADTEKFFLGGRSLGPWVSAMSAEASDMSVFLPHFYRLQLQLVEYSRFYTACK